ncbi:hypothetical protein ACIGW0_12140 [Streptomyces bikiniensis]|uniref:Uncharacterized protein n=1 Tax=Streptomyces bikiniensis TaxID=1896 RepID=A0ABW8CTF2_STRBI
MHDPEVQHEWMDFDFGATALGSSFHRDWSDYADDALDHIARRYGSEGDPTPLLLHAAHGRRPHRGRGDAGPTGPTLMRQALAETFEGSPVLPGCPRIEGTDRTHRGDPYVAMEGTAGGPGEQ